MVRALPILTSIAIHGAILGVAIGVGGLIASESVEGEVAIEVDLNLMDSEANEAEKVIANEVKPLPSITPLITVQPKYPRKARKLGIEGTTQVRVLIGNDGLVKEALLESSSGHKDLDNAAIEAARSSRFSVETIGSSLERKDAILTFEFTLDGKH